MVLQPKIASKLHRKAHNFLFFATFESIRGLVGIQVAYVCVMHVYQGAYSLKKMFFKRNLNKIGWKMCK